MKISYQKQARCYYVIEWNEMEGLTVYRFSSNADRKFYGTYKLKPNTWRPGYEDEAGSVYASHPLLKNIKNETVWTDIKLSIKSPDCDVGCANAFRGESHCDEDCVKGWVLYGQRWMQSEWEE